MAGIPFVALASVDHIRVPRVLITEVVFSVGRCLGLGVKFHATALPMAVAVKITYHSVATNTGKIYIACAMPCCVVTGSLVGTFSNVVCIVDSNCFIGPGGAPRALSHRTICAYPVRVRSRVCLPAFASVVCRVAIAMTTAGIWAC